MVEETLEAKVSRLETELAADKKNSLALIAQIKDIKQGSNEMIDKLKDQIEVLKEEKKLKISVLTFGKNRYPVVLPTFKYKGEEYVTADLKDEAIIEMAIASGTILGEAINTKS